MVDSPCDKIRFSPFRSFGRSQRLEGKIGNRSYTTHCMSATCHAEKKLKAMTHPRQNQMIARSCPDHDATLIFDQPEMLPLFPKSSRSMRRTPRRTENGNYITMNTRTVETMNEDKHTERATDADGQFSSLSFESHQIGVVSRTSHCHVLCPLLTSCEGRTQQTQLQNHSQCHADVPLQQRDDNSLLWHRWKTGTQRSTRGPVPSLAYYVAACVYVLSARIRPTWDSTPSGVHDYY